MAADTKKTGKPAYQPTRFMLPTSHYDRRRADRAVSFIQGLKHTKGVWAGKPFLLNPAPWQPLPDELLCGIDWFTPNETEAGGCSGIGITDGESVRRAAHVLLGKGIRNVVITLGHRGTYWTDGTREITVPGIRVQAVETTGAGDTFNGALAVAVAEGRDPEWALRFANAAAALSVTRLGAAVSAPTRDEILSMMAAQYGCS